MVDAKEVMRRSKLAMEERKRKQMELDRQMDEIMAETIDPSRIQDEESIQDDENEIHDNDE